MAWSVLAARRRQGPALGRTLWGLEGWAATNAPTEGGGERGWQRSAVALVLAGLSFRDRV